MKKFILLSILCSVALGCNNDKNEEKATLDNIIKVHDRVMAGDEQLMKNKTKLDAISKQGNLRENDSAKILDNKLADAETRMDTWMHKFNLEFKGKSHEETMNYLKARQVEIQKIDSAVTSANKQSAIYLSAPGKK